MRKMAQTFILWGLSAACVHAGFVPMQISIPGNTTFTTFPGSAILLNGNLFPTGSQTYNGRSFSIGSVWSADTAAGGVRGAGMESVFIPINAYGVSTVYTLMNTEWSLTSGTPLSLLFTFANGSTYTVNPVSGQAVRDYNNFTWQNTISSSWSAPMGMTDSTMMAWNDNGLSPCSNAPGNTCSVASGNYQRLDEQIINIPLSFQGVTLQSLTIFDNGDHVTPGDALNPAPNDAQRSFIAAMTVDATQIPEPGTLAMLFCGAGAILALRKRLAA